MTVQEPSWVQAYVNKDIYDYLPYQRAIELLKKQARPGGIVVDLGAGIGNLGRLIVENDFQYYAIEAFPEAVQILRERGIPHSPYDLNDSNGLKTIFDSLDNISAFCLIDVIEHLPEPNKL